MMRPVTQLPNVHQGAARKLPLHQRIVWARKQKGISQERLAEQIGTSRRHMIRIEKGLHHPGPAFRARIAEATEQPEDFFESDDDEEAASMALDLMSALRRVVDARLAVRS